MGVRPSCLFLSLLAFFWVGGGAPATADPLFHPGGVRLVLPPGAVSFFPLDIPAMAERACGLEPGRKPGKALAQCHVVVRGSGSDFLDATARLMFMHFSSKAAETSCGLWDVTLTLAPIHLQPVLEMRTSLHLANRKTSQTAEFALRPGSGLAGPWILTPTGKSRNPIFLADDSDDGGLTFEGCIPAWVFEDPTLEVDKEEACEVCPADDEKIDRR